MVLGRLVQRRPHLAHVQPPQPYPRLDQGDRVSAALGPQVDEGTVEAVQQAVDHLVVTGAQRRVERQRDLRHEAEDRRRVQRDPDAPVREAGQFGGRQPVEVEEFTGNLAAHRAHDPLHQVEIAHAVLEADDPLGAGQFDHGLGREHGVVALVDHDVQRGGGGEFPVVPQESLLARQHQVRRHREQSVGPGLLGEASEPYGERGPVPGARDDRNAPGGRLHGRPHTLLELLGRERVELPGAAAREDGRGTVLDAAPHMGAVGVEVEGAVGAVRRDGEEQRPAGDAEPSNKGGWRHGLSLGQVLTHTTAGTRF